MASAKRTKFYTPVVPSKWAWLTVPDTKFNPETGGDYKVDLIMTPEQANALKAKVQADVTEQEAAVRAGLTAAEKKWKTVWPMKPQTNEEGNETGSIVAAFRQKAKVVKAGKPDMIFSVSVFDAKMKALPASVQLGNGSEMSVCFNVRVVKDSLGKCVRVKFQPIGAQVVKLVERTADFSGFAEQEGFDAGDATVSQEIPASTEGEAADNPDF